MNQDPTGKDIVMQLHGPEIITQLQQENQALREQIELLKIRYAEAKASHDAALKTGNIEYLRYLKADSKCNKLDQENTRLRDALRYYAEFAGTTEIEYDLGKRAKQALAPQEGAQKE